ncbi:ATP-binding protein [Embleya sp. NPDC050154]|uniref:ATP-binding protein n=1 Tax=Embleya sp. NPDC050154 TaxID=3363988 RepID=UPI0037B16377
MSGDKGPSQATALVSLARAAFDLVVSEDARPYGVRRNGPNIAMPLRGKAGLRAELARRFTDANGGNVPSQSALADAMTVLEGIAAATDPIPVHLRVAGDAELVVIDLGTADGRCVIAEPDGWHVAERAPVLFRRSGAMSPMPEPIRDDVGFAHLRDLLNMDDTTFHQLVAWLVAAWIPHIPHPVLTFKGEQGTGKSKAAQLVIGLVDASPATKRSQPRDVKTWATQAFNSWALCLDNVSTIPPWLSDTLCKAVTGDGIIDRALYTDDDVVVLTFRRVLAMTTIDAGAFAGDLAERLLMLDLQLIEEHHRRSEEDLDRTYATARPNVLAALLDLLCEVLRVLPDVRLERMPRMADYARVLAAVDTVQGWNTLDNYVASSQRVAADALEGDPFGSAVAHFIETHGAWTGTTAHLLDLIPPPETHHPKWPKDATRAGGQLRRLAPLFRSIGITYDDTARSSDRHRHRLITLTCPEIVRKTASNASTASVTPADLPLPTDTTVRASVHTEGGQRPQNTDADATYTAPDTAATAVSEVLDGVDQGKHGSPDTAGPVDAGMRSISGYYLLCATCGDPVDPADTAAGHLTHPGCAP